MIRPLHNAKSLIGATLLAGATMIGALSCSNSTRKSDVDLRTCHNVELMGRTMKIQDGVSLELKSKTYLMSNGKLLVYNKERKTWSDTNGVIDDIYNYQADVFKAVAGATEEMKDTLVLSEDDIKYIQKHPQELNENRHYIDYGMPELGGSESRKVKETKGNGIVISADEYSFRVNHYTPNLTIMYNSDKETVEK